MSLIRTVLVRYFRFLMAIPCRTKQHSAKGHGDDLQADLCLKDFSLKSFSEEEMV